MSYYLLFLIYETSDGVYDFNKDISAILNKYNASSRHEALDEMHDFILGVVLTHGSISYDDLLKLYKTVKKESKIFDLRGFKSVN